MKPEYYPFLVQGGEGPGANYYLKGLSTDSDIYDCPGSTATKLFSVFDFMNSTETRFGVGQQSLRELFATFNITI